MISFYFYHHYFHIQYNYYYRNYFLFSVYNIFFSSSCSKSVLISLIILPLINLSLICFFSLISFFLFCSFSFSKSVQISVIDLSLTFQHFLFFFFLMLLILFSSDYFCVFDLLSFFPLPYTAFLGVFVLKRLTSLSLKPPKLLLMGAGI